MEKEYFLIFFSLDCQPGSSRKQNPEARMKLLVLFGRHKEQSRESEGERETMRSTWPSRSAAELGSHIHVNNL